MVQCPDAHPFCTTCISTYASTQLGTHNSNLTCIHPSSCYLPFPTSELKRILSVKLFELYERLEQQKEIKQAGLVGLEECPFCEWKCVVEDLTEGNLFPCGNEEGGCGVVSCRGCKKLVRHDFLYSEEKMILFECRTICQKVVKVTKVSQVYIFFRLTSLSSNRSGRR